MPLVNASRDLSIVAHQDDDLLFMNPDIQASIDAGNEVTTLYITAGDAGEGEDYWSGREQGVKDAYAAMAGGGDWVDEITALAFGGTTYEIHSSTLASTPDVRLYFLRMPDGGEDGLPRYSFESLTKLNDGLISTITSVDGAATYTKSGVIGAIGAVLEHHQPDQIRVQDYQSAFAAGEHRDHLTTAILTDDALAAYTASQYTVTSYVHYGSVELRANLSVADQAQTLETFLTYAENDSYVFIGDGELNPLYPLWAQRQYISSEVTVAPSGTNSVTGTYALETIGAGVAGANVYLFNAAAGEIIATARTSLNGDYQFHDIPAGASYRVLFQDPTSLGGTFISFGFSPQSGDNDVTQTFANGLGTTNLFSIAAGQSITDVDAAIYNANPSAISGVYFIDSDQNGVLGQSEAGVSGAVVTLFDSDTQTVQATAVTNANGAYSFENVAPNTTYHLAFSGPDTLGSALANYRFDLGAGQITALDPAGAGILPDIAVALGTSFTDMNAGLLVPNTATVAGRVFADSNANGLNDISETGISGATVTLVNVATNTAVATTNTDLAGNYLFAAVTPNQNYIVQFDPSNSTDPAYLTHSFGFSLADLGQDDRIDSDVTSATILGRGETAAFSVATNQTVAHIDAGLLPAEAASISGRYFVDHNNNGIDDGAIGLANATVTLFQGDIAIAVTNTNHRGQYTFDEIQHGDDFFVMFENPDFVANTQTNGFTNGHAGLTPLAGIASHVTDQILYGNGRTDTFSLTTGQELNGIGAGVFAFNGGWDEDGMLGG